MAAAGDPRAGGGAGDGGSPPPSGVGVRGVSRGLGALGAGWGLPRRGHRRDRPAAVGPGQGGGATEPRTPRRDPGIPQIRVHSTPVLTRGGGTSGEHLRRRASCAVQPVDRPRGHHRDVGRAPLLRRPPGGAVIAAQVVLYFAVALVGLGFVALVARRSLIWKLLGLNVASGGAILFLVALSRRPGGKPPLLGYPEGTATADPLPQALVLTAIVIHFATLALSLAYAISLTERLHTQDTQRIEEHAEEEMSR
ncbi:TPA: hypothetical protein EYP84_01335 [Candidatus Bipolaricaulota bacterium]|nr:hypothetical protein [Candidatus Bipolaricaulota bacterium]